MITNSMQKYYMSLRNEIDNINLESNDSDDLQKVKKIIRGLSSQERSELGPRWFYDDSQYRLVKEKDDKPVGFIENRITGKKGHLNIAVLSDYRGQGIAKKLVNKAIEATKNQFENVEKIYWVTTTNNTASMQLAESSGFVKISENDDEVRFALEIERSEEEGGARRMARIYGAPTPGQLEKINALAKRPLSAKDVFVFPGKAIGDGLIPTRMMRVHKSLMEVFKADAQRGVALMLDHAWANFGTMAFSYGRTFDATLKKTMDSSETDETWALFLDHYMVRGREKNGVSTDQLIADIEDGVVFDTSIGFGNETYICSICGNNYMDYEKCKHFRGQEYEGQICSVILKPPGFLMEDSLVFDGAYPGAGVLSAMSVRDMENAFDPVEDLKEFKEGTRFLHTFSDSRGAMNTFVLREPIKGIVVPDITGLATGRDIPGKGIPKTVSTQTQTETQTQGKEDEVTLTKEAQVFAAVLAAAGITTEGIEAMTADQIMAVFTAKTTESIKLTIQENTQEATATLMFALTEPDIRRALGLTEQADQPIPENWATRAIQLAQEGRESRQELITDTLEWGVRAHGNDFAMESYREILSEPGRTVQAIKDMREQFKKKAGEGLATGRQTQIQANGDEKAQSQAHIPAEAYKI